MSMYKPFTCIRIDKNHPQSNIYLCDKNFLKPKNQTQIQRKFKLEQLALMDIVAIINLIDNEILYQEIPQLNPTTVEKCAKIPFLENEGAVKLIDDVLKIQSKSVIIYSDQTYRKSHQLLVCYLIYDQFKIMTDITKEDTLENRLCEINFESKEIALTENKLQITRGIYGNPIFPNYRFQVDIEQISEVQKFNLTKLLSQQTYTNKQKDLEYFFNYDTLNIMEPPNQQFIINKDINNDYFKELEPIKNNQAQTFPSFIQGRK